jgi:hypothetical protein
MVKDSRPVRQIVFSHLGSFANAKRANPPANAGGFAEKGCGAHRHWRSKGTLASKGRARIDRGAVEAVRVRRSKRRRRSGQRRTARRLVSPARSRGLCSNLDHMLHWCPRAIFFAASKAQFAIGWEREGQFAYRAWTKLEGGPYRQPPWSRPCQSQSQRSDSACPATSLSTGSC